MSPAATTLTTRGLRADVLLVGWGVRFGVGLTTPPFPLVDVPSGSLWQPRAPKSSATASRRPTRHRVAFRDACPVRPRPAEVTDPPPVHRTGRRRARLRPSHVAPDPWGMRGHNTTFVGRTTRIVESAAMRARLCRVEDAQWDA